MEIWGGLNMPNLPDLHKSQEVPVPGYCPPSPGHCPESVYRIYSMVLPVLGK